MLPFGLTFWAFRRLFAFPHERIYFTYSDALFLLRLFYGIMGHIESTKLLSIVCNADMRIGEIRRFCKPDETSESLMRSAMNQLNLTARAYHRILKLVRTITDLVESDAIQPPHLAETL